MAQWWNDERDLEFSVHHDTIAPSPLGTLANFCQPAQQGQPTGLPQPPAYPPAAERSSAMRSAKPQVGRQPRTCLALVMSATGQRIGGMG